jgi:hypothetical protein
MDIEKLIQDGAMALENARKIGPEKTKKTREILEKNADKDFVQRILAPGGYPEMQNDDGTHSTHRMSYGGGDGKYYVFPTLFHNRERGTL